MSVNSALNGSTAFRRSPGDAAGSTEMLKSRSSLSRKKSECTLLRLVPPLNTSAVPKSGTRSRSTSEQ